MTDNYRIPAAFALAVVALDALSLGLVLPVLPTLVQDVGQDSDSQTAFYVGSLFSVFAFMQFLFSPIVGALSDRFGRRPVLLISLSLLGLTTLFWVWASSIALLFTLRVLQGIFSSNVSTASAYIADITPKDKRAQYFGLIGAMYGVGFIIGPTIGGVLGQTWIRLPFLVAACLIIFNALFGFFMLPESLPPEKRSAFELLRANPFGAIKAIGNGPGQKRLVITWCLIWMTIGAHQATFILSNQIRFGWSILLNGLVVGLGGIFQIAAMATLVPVTTKKWGEKGTALVGLLFGALAYLTLAFADLPWIVYTGVLILALSTLSIPAVQAMLSIGASEERQGAIQGALTSLQGLMLVVAPLSMGALFSYATRTDGAFHFVGAPFFAAAVFSVLGFFVMMGLKGSFDSRNVVVSTPETSVLESA